MSDSKLDRIMTSARCWAESDAEVTKILGAYIQRTWHLPDNPCTHDAICLLAIEQDVDPRPLMMMAQAAGDIDLGLEGYLDTPLLK